MKYPPRTEDSPRTYKDCATQTSPATQDSWLVVGLVCGLRLFFVFCLAFARAVIIVSGGSFPDSLFDEIIPTTLSNHSSSPQTSSGSLDTTRTTIVESKNSRSPKSEGHYVIFTGREVGYTTNSVLMASLVQGIPNNFARKFNTFEEAKQAYSEAVMYRKVRRVQPVIQPSGHIEFMYEYVGSAVSMRNLDEPRLPPHPLVPVSSPPAPHSIPCNSEASASHRDEATNTKSSSDTTVADATSPAVPFGWSMVNNACEASADTVILSTTSGNPTDGPLATQPGALTVIFLESDEESSISSVLVNSSTSSVHSSDIYYADKTYDTAFAAYIEEEDRIISNVDGVVNESSVST